MRLSEDLRLAEHHPLWQRLTEHGPSRSLRVDERPTCLRSCRRRKSGFGRWWWRSGHCGLGVSDGWSWNNSRSCLLAWLRRGCCGLLLNDGLSRGHRVSSSARVLNDRHAWSIGARNSRLRRHWGRDRVGSGRPRLSNWNLRHNGLRNRNRLRHNHRGLKSKLRGDESLRHRWLHHWSRLLWHEVTLCERIWRSDRVLLARREGLSCHGRLRDWYLRRDAGLTLSGLGCLSLLSQHHLLHQRRLLSEQRLLIQQCLIRVLSQRNARGGCSRSLSWQRSLSVRSGREVGLRVRRWQRNDRHSADRAAPLRRRFWRLSRNRLRSCHRLHGHESLSWHHRGAEAVARSVDIGSTHPASTIRPARGATRRSAARTAGGASATAAGRSTTGTSTAPAGRTIEGAAGIATG